MHGGQAFLLILVVLLVLALPAFVFGFLAVKCVLYRFPRIKRYFFIRWVLPVVVAFGLLFFAMYLTLAYQKQPWPTSPVLSGWQCLGLVCLLDLVLLFLWPCLKYREYRQKHRICPAEVVEPGERLSSAGATAVKGRIATIDEDR